MSAKEVNAGKLQAEVEKMIERTHDLADPPLTWETLTEKEPALIALNLAIEYEAKRGQGASRYCANNVWYTYFKPWLSLLVGWTARSPDLMLRSEKAYDLVYERLYEKLPDCKGCNCW